MARSNDLKEALVKHWVKRMLNIHTMAPGPEGSVGTVIAVGAIHVSWDGESQPRLAFTVMHAYSSTVLDATIVYARGAIKAAEASVLGADRFSRFLIRVLPHLNRLGIAERNWVATTSWESLAKWEWWFSETTYVVVRRNSVGEKYLINVYSKSGTYGMFYPQMTGCDIAKARPHWEIFKKLRGEMEWTTT